MSGSEVALHDSATAQALTRPPRFYSLDANQLAVIKSTVAKNATDVELAYFLELATHLDLDPFANEIWCAKGRGRDGGSGRLLVMVGRDGLLKVANRHADYHGYDCDVIHEHDHFERVEPDPGRATMRGRAGVVHTYGHPKERGEIVGAWAICERGDRPPRFFYADLDEYRPKSPDSYSPWTNQPSAMIDKVAISMVLRTTFNITGVHVEEEMARVVEGEVVDVDVSVPWPEGTLGARMREAVEKINAAEPNTYPPAVLQMMIAGQGEGVLNKLALDLEREARVVLNPTDPDAMPDGTPVDEGEQIEALQVRLSLLYDSLNAVTDIDPHDPKLDEISAEIDRVEAELQSRGVGGTDETVAGEVTEL